MKNKTIECKDIKKSFQNGDRRIEVLHGVNLTTYEQEMIMLMGPSGSGKTTLISIIGGILEQDNGECLVLSKNINKMPLNQKTQFRGKNIGFLFQHFILVPTLTALENAAIPLLCSSVDEEIAFDKAKRLLEQFDIGEHIHKKPDQLSGGEQQRVAIARAVIHDPKIILCDEPTSFLDLERGKKIMEILQTIKEKNHCTLIVVTHDPRILSFADRIVRIEDGRIKHDKINNKKEL
jgi:putative ABC transport system ATP-binding protein